MNADKKVITITVINAGHVYVVKTFANEYRNLMVLLNNNIYLESFGECGGMGRCATCVVSIAGLKSMAAAMDRNEMTTISKADFTGTQHPRLACQILITEELDNTVVTITG